MEGSHEQRTSEYASGRWSASALRSEDAVARVSRAAARRVAGATRCMAGQRHAWKANYVGAYGPRVPSVVGPVILICVGVIALLLATGHIDASSFSAWYGHWWPLLLIVAGLALLGEWALDMRRPTPVHRSGSFVGILFLVAFLGLCAAGWNHMRPFVGGWNGDNDFFNFWGQPEHDLDQQALHEPGSCECDDSDS